MTDTGRIANWLRTIRRVRDIYVEAHGRKLNLLRPRRFTEKMQWRKLFDQNPIFTVFCDKIAVRDFITARIGAEYLVPTAWMGGVEEIPFDRLTPPYVLKSTHASGHVIRVTAESPPDLGAIKTRTAAWLQINYFEVSGEPGYRTVPRRLMAEQMLLTADGGPPEERRLFVFNGKVAVINTVFVDEGVVRNGAFHTPDWKRLNWYFTRFVTRDFPQPPRLAEMISVAERLGEGIDHIRVDIYDCGDGIFVGELTPYSWGGLSRFNPDTADLLLGRYWRLRWRLLRAIAALLFSSR